MVQGGEIAFGDTTNSNFFGIAEGTNNSFSDSDTMGIYYRNGLNIYSANNTQRVKILANGNVGINETNPDTKLEIAGAHVSGIGLAHIDSTDHAFIALDAHSSSHNKGIYFQENGVHQLSLIHI